MLVPVLPGSPRASITPPATGYEDGARIPCSTAQKSVFELPNAAASMNAEEPKIEVPEQLERLAQIAFWPAVCAAAGKGKTATQIRTRSKVPKNVHRYSGPEMFFICMLLLVTLS